LFPNVPKARRGPRATACRLVPQRRPENPQRGSIYSRDYGAHSPDGREALTLGRPIR
jgi:hypothetical protein